MKATGEFSSRECKTFNGLCSLISDKPISSKTIVTWDSYYRLSLFYFSNNLSNFYYYEIALSNTYYIFYDVDYKFP